MKKSLISILILSSTVLLVGCQNNASNSSKSSSEKNKSTAVKKSSKPTDNDKVKNQKFSFNDKQVDNSEFTIKITKHKVIKPGKKGNSNGKKPVIAFWYEVKSKTDNKVVDPLTAWQAVLKAEQLDDKATKQTLNVAPLPDNKYLESQRTVIKKGKTVENAIAYELNTLKNPVKLIAIKGIFGEGSGEETFKLK